jgi:hypothetical protein
MKNAQKCGAKVMYVRTVFGELAQMYVGLSLSLFFSAATRGSGGPDVGNQVMIT